DNVWLLSDLGINSAQIDFSDGFLSIESIDIDADLANSASFIADSSGNLILYTNGCHIYNADHEIINNGNRINPGETWDNYCPFDSGYPMVTQSSLFLPWPESETDYILFHQSISFVIGPNGGVVAELGPLLYSIVSFESDPIGQVILKNETLYDELPKIEGGAMTANRHANGIDWWITNRLSSGGGILKYLLTSNGLEGPFVQEVGWYPEGYQSGGGECEFSSDGTRYVFNSSRSGMEIYDFDRETGEFSFIDTIDRQSETDDIVFTGIGLSPSGRFAYVSENFFVYQYDLDAENIEESQVLIHAFSNPDSLLIFPHSQHFQLGPDCKLYNYMNSGRYIHRINQPDLPGLACDYEVNAIFLPFSAFRDQPQFPHFRLGPVGDEGSPCVEGPLSTTTVAAPTANLKVYPNPGTGPIRLFLPSGEAPAQWRLFDLQGRPLYELDLLPGQHQRVDLSDDLPTGAYLWQLVRHGQVVEMGRVVR
ncbi:MAG: hypothetical protein AAFY91_12815, partial [Bacteroidota bacterium]